jgi:hypothetical protein
MGFAVVGQITRMPTPTGFSDLNETCVGQNGSCGLHFIACGHSQLPLVEVAALKFAAWPQVCTLLHKTFRQVVNLSVHQDGGCPSNGILEILVQELESLKSECHAITNTQRQFL